MIEKPRDDLGNVIKRYKRPLNREKITKHEMDLYMLDFDPLIE